MSEQLSAVEKIIQVLYLSKQGLTRQEIANQLYPSSDSKACLGGLRKLMKRKGYVWDDELGTYSRLNASDTFLVGEGKYAFKRLRAI